MNQNFNRDEASFLVNHSLEKVVPEVGIRKHWIWIAKLFIEISNGKFAFSKSDFFEYADGDEVVWMLCADALCIASRSTDYIQAMIMTKAVHTLRWCVRSAIATLILSTQFLPFILLFRAPALIAEDLKRINHRHHSESVDGALKKMLDVSVSARVLRPVMKSVRSWHVSFADFVKFREFDDVT